jgi:hypothetical protein
VEAQRLTARLSLHDTLLDTVAIDYRDSSVVFSVRMLLQAGQPQKIGRIELKGLKELKLGSEQPWGPSTSINSAHIESAGDLQRLLIELQSGDEIVAVAKSIVLQDIKIAEGRPA